MTRVIVSGPIANKPGNGGIAWNVLSYVRGLERLGHEVILVEAIVPEACTDRYGRPACFEESYNLAHFKAVVSQFQLLRSALIYNRGEKAYGMAPSELADVTRNAQLLINISGNLSLEAPFDAVPCRVYVDEDPGYTQFWQMTGVEGLNLAGHDHYVTIGENIGRADCSIPRGDYDWRPTRQPVVLDDWPVVPADGPLRFTTVASWRGAFGSVEFEGRRFGLKAHEFRKFVALPCLVDCARFEIALDIHEGDAADLDSLVRHAWVISDPSQLVADPLRFREYVQSSSAEFSVSQGIYVDTNSGWFSDRSARYLASGRPVLVQDTGFGRSIASGEGLLSFRTMDEALAGVRAIQEDYDRHSRAARALAERYFSSDEILSNLLEQVL
jgi:hypothetical protein